jgi:hypothetical protein
MSNPITFEESYALLKEELGSETDPILMAYQNGDGFESLFDPTLNKLLSYLQKEPKNYEAISDEGNRVLALSKLAYITYSRGMKADRQISDDGISALIKYENEVVLSVRSISFVFGKSDFKCGMVTPEKDNFEYLICIHKNEDGQIIISSDAYSSP